MTLPHFDPQSPHVAPKGAFVCQRCGQCCLGRGGTWLNFPQVKALAKFLNLETNFLIKTYLEKPENPPNEKTSSKPSRLWTIGVALNGYCKFFDPNPKACLIHSVKPLSCRLWPFYHLLINSKDGFLEAQTHCPGLNELDYGAFLAAFENSDWKVIPARLRAQLLAEGDEPLAKSPGGFD